MSVIGQIDSKSEYNVNLQTLIHMTFPDKKNLDSESDSE